MGMIRGYLNLKPYKDSSQQATNYVTDIGTFGIFVHPEGYGPDDTPTPTGWKIADALELFNAGTSVIKVWNNDSIPTVRVGAETDGNVTITSLGIDIYNGQLDNVFHAGLSTNTMTYERHLVGPLKVAPSTTVSATIPTLANGTTVYYEVASGTAIIRDAFTFGEAVSGGGFEYDGGTRITYTSASGTNPDFLTIYLDVTDEVAPAWTFGARVGDIGGFSTVVGLNCEASKNYAYAIGQTAKATGFLSFAQGSYVTAAGTWQHVIGKWNEIDTADKYAFIIGNGSAAGGRKDALTVDWSGNVIATSFTGALYGNATTSNVSVRATYASYYSSDTIGITAYSSNEINFVGESTADRVYIGYRTLESPAISNYFFCDSSSSTSGRGNIYCGALDTTGITISGISLIYIVETGTSGSWRYVKWSDGRAELWGWFSQSVSAYATNSFVIGSASVTAYPFTITEPKTIVSGQRINNGGCYVSYDYGRTDYWSGIANPTVGITITQGTTATITWTCYVNARWK